VSRSQSRAARQRPPRFRCVDAVTLSPPLRFHYVHVVNRARERANGDRERWASCARERWAFGESGDRKRAFGATPPQAAHLSPPQAAHLSPPQAAPGRSPLTSTILIDVTAP
jgi:hypothetical protein